MKKICIVGCEGVGKTTLIKKLSKYFNELFVIEFGKKYCEKYLKNGYIKNNKINTIKKDYKKIINGQKQILDEIQKQSKKIFLRDTDFVYTKYFYNKQFDDSSWIDKEIKKQQIDWYIFIKNKNIFLRKNTIIKSDKIEEETNILLKLYKSFFLKKLLVIESTNQNFIFNKIIDFLKQHGIKKNSN